MDHKFVCRFQMMMMISDNVSAFVMELSNVEDKIKFLVPISQ